VYPEPFGRVFDGEKRGEPSLTQIAIPALELPHETVVALVDIPTVAKLHTPLNLTLSIRNYHPTLSANILCHLETDNVDTFVVSGLRSGRLPILLPGAEERVVWRLIPLECGHMQLPKIKIFNRRKALTPAQVQNSAEGPGGSSEGEIVEIIDVRRDGRISLEADSGSGAGLKDDRPGQMTILVRP
jgi:hypothetical protein